MLQRVVNQESCWKRKPCI